MKTLVKFLFALTLLTSLNLKAERNVNFTNSIIIGQLIDQNGQPISDREVVIIDFKDTELASKKLTRHGRFTLEVDTSGPFYIFFRNLKNKLISKKAYIINGLIPEVNFIATHNLGNKTDTRDYTFKFDDDGMNQINKTWRKSQDIVRSYYDIIISYASSQDADSYTSIDFSDTLRKIENKIAAEKNTVKKACLYIEYLTYEGLKSYIRSPDLSVYPESKIGKVFKVNLKTNIVEDAFKFITPDSKLWSTSPYALRSILRIFPEKYLIYRTYFEELISITTDRNLASETLLALIEFAKNNGHSKDFLNFHGLLGVDLV